MTTIQFISQTISRLRLRLRFQQSVKLAFVLTAASSVAAMASNPTWEKPTNAGGNGSTVAYAIKIAPNNDQYVAGKFTLNATFASTTLVSQGGADIFLARYSPSGALLWAVDAGGAGDDEALAVSVDSDENVYLTGSFMNSATFNSTNHAPKTVTGAGQTSYLAKYNSAGHIAWIQTGVSSEAGFLNSGSGLAVDSAAHTVYMTLKGQGNTTFSSANGTSTTISGVGSWHAVLAKYDTSGDFQWAQTNWASPNSIPYGVAVDGNDNAYLVGWMENETTFSSANGHNITVTGFSPGQSNTDYPADAYVAKYDSSGNAQWVNHVGGYKAIGNAIAVRTNGEVSITGFIGNINYGSASEAKTIVTSQAPGANISLGGGTFTDPYNHDVFVATFTTAGVLKGAFRYGASQDETATSIKYNPAGSVIIAGLSGASTGSPTLFVRKYWDGGLVWQQTAPNIGLWFSEGGSPSLSVDSSGKAYVSGGYSGTANFGTFPLTASGSSNMFLGELSHE